MLGLARLALKSGKQAWHGRNGSRTVLAVTSAERQLTLRFRTKSLQRGSRQFRANNSHSLRLRQKASGHSVTGVLARSHELPDLRLGTPLAEALWDRTELTLAIEEFVSN